MYKKLALLISLFVIPVANIIAAERTVNAALTSNYVFRGQTQTNDKLAVQATYHAAQSKDKGWYAGVFGSNVEKGAEVDLYGGWRAPFAKESDFAFDVGAVEYIYTDSAFADSYYEVYGGLSFQSYYLRYFVGQNDADYLDFGASFFVMDDFGIDIHYGRTFGLQNNGNDVGVTLQKDIKDILLLSVALTYEDLKPGSDVEFFVTVSKDFNL